MNLEYSPQNETLSLREQILRTAEQLVDYSLEVKSGDKIFIKLAPACKDLCDAVIQTLQARGARYFIQILDQDVDKAVLEGVSSGNFSLPSSLSENYPNNQFIQDVTVDGEKRQVGADELAFFNYGPGSDELSILNEANKVLIIKERRSISEKYAISAEIQQEKDKMDRILTDVRVNEKRWCLISVPTEKSVRPEGMSFDQYAKLYYEACGRPWQEVEEAQKILVEKFTGKTSVRIDVPSADGNTEWETHLTMEIVGQIPVNSVAKRNMPGSEVFMAPNIHTDEAGNKKGTLNGVLAVHNPVYFRERVLPDLRLTFKDGKVVEWFTSGSDEDKKLIAETLKIDDGAAWCGELGIGTNPKVDIPVQDTLLAEKSFGIHLAIGNAYSYKMYIDTPVNIDNGNRSSIHIDIPRIMTKQFGGGKIIVDDVVIFEDGKFLDPKLSVLNN